MSLWGAGQLEEFGPSDFKFKFDIAKEKGHAYFSCLNSGLIEIFKDYGFPTEDFLLRGDEAVRRRIKKMSEKYSYKYSFEDICSDLEITDAVNGLVRKRRFSDALRIMSYSKGFLKDKSVWLYSLAQVYYHSGDINKAISTYNEVLKMKLHPKIKMMTRFFLKIALQDIKR